MNGGGCSSGNLNQTPKGGQSGRGSRFFGLPTQYDSVSSNAIINEP